MNILLIIGSVIAFRALYVWKQRKMEEADRDLEAAKSFNYEHYNWLVGDSISPADRLDSPRVALRSGLRNLPYNGLSQKQIQKNIQAKEKADR